MTAIRVHGAAVVLPAVEPERIAEAIVESCRHRRAVVAVPRWMEPTRHWPR